MSSALFLADWRWLFICIKKRIRTKWLKKLGNHRIKKFYHPHIIDDDLLLEKENIFCIANINLKSTQLFIYIFLLIRIWAYYQNSIIHKIKIHFYIIIMVIIILPIWNQKPRIDEIQMIFPFPVDIFIKTSYQNVFVVI